jgi:predicted RNA-binding protein with PIN domain
LPVLIDGHNLIGRLSMLSLQDPDDEDKLITLLQSYRARTGKKITVVFDPGGAFALAESYRRGGIEVVFAAHGSSADAVIIRRVSRSPEPNAWLVVTSDQQLAATVSQRGARVQSAEAFAQALSTTPGEQAPWKDSPPSPEEVEAWLALFENGN